MIFVTIGTQEPFDRLIRAVDAWAARNPEVELFAQIGEGEPPCAMDYAEHIAPADFQGWVERAEAVVSHAGMGTILTTLTLGKPLLVLPRLASLGEHRNEHQVATVRRLEELGVLRAARDEADLVRRLDELRSSPPAPPLRDHASPELLQRLRAFFAET